MFFLAISPLFRQAGGLTPGPKHPKRGEGLNEACHIKNFVSTLNAGCKVNDQVNHHLPQSMVRLTSVIAPCSVPLEEVGPGMFKLNSGTVHI